MLRTFATCFLVLMVAPVFAQVEPYDLTVEYRTAPVGIDTESPRLSWKSRTIRPNVRNVTQNAYRILVASSPELLAEDKGDLWDSGQVESNCSRNIEYAGKPLTSSLRCYWKVRAWYQSDEQPLGEGIESTVSRWVMGIMRPDDWKAEWIGSEEKFRPNFDFHGNVQWIWTGDATDLSVAPAGKRYYRGLFTNPQTQTEASRTTLAITADDTYKVFLNGQAVTQTWGHFNDPKWMRFIDISDRLRPGVNVIGIEVANKTQGPTGVSAGIVNAVFSYVTTKDWLASAEPTEGWNSDPNFKSDHWKPACEIGPIDCEPWGKIERRVETVSPAFGKTFTLAPKKKVKQATLHITGLGFYEATLNGKRIGEKVLDPVQTRYDKRVMYSTYEMEELLRPGENRMEVLLGHGWYDVRSVAVWNFDNAPWRDFPRVLAQLEIVYEDGSKEKIVSDASWDQTESPILFDCIRQGEISTTLETRKVIGKAVVVDAPKGKLTAEALPPSVIAQELRPVRITEPEPGVYLVDFGQNIAGWAKLKMTGQKDGDIVQLKYTERLDKNGRGDMKPINEHFRHRSISATVDTAPAEKFPNDMFQIDTYLCKGLRSETYEPRFIYHGFQYVEITGLTRKPTARSIAACVVQTDFKQIGNFECSNRLFNKIQQATLWAYRGNFVNGVPTDCPHREKNGWTGDAQLAMEQAQYNWENTAAYEKWIGDLLDEQQPDGNLPGIVPTSGWGYQWGNGPAWDSALITIPSLLYLYRGDKRIVETAYDGMKKYHAYLKSREKSNGLIDHGLGDWCVANTKTPTVVTSSYFYWLDTLFLALAAGEQGKNGELLVFWEQAKKIYENYTKALVKEDGTVANGSQTAQSLYLLLSAGYADPPLSCDPKNPVFQKLLEAIEKADNHIDVGILGMGPLLDMLSSHGRADLVVKMLNQKTPPGYGDWIERGATTLWEDWKDGASRNHIMYGTVSTWFYQVLAGLRPSGKPGVMCVCPEFPEGIDWVKAAYDSPHGMIKVDWKRTGKPFVPHRRFHRRAPMAGRFTKPQVVLTVSVPVNTTIAVRTSLETPLMAVVGAGMSGQGAEGITLCGSGEHSFVLETK